MSSRKSFKSAPGATAIILAMVGLVPAVTHAQTAKRASLTLAGAQRVMAAAVMEAGRDGAGGTIAIVDDGGHLVLLQRLDNTFAASPQIATGKAKTAALFQKPTRVFEEIIAGGRTSMVTLPDFTPLQGGVPIVVENQVVGAIGVSGAASARRDEEIALAGAAVGECLADSVTAPGPVRDFDSREVAAAFARGAPLLEVEGYKVHASRREAPGMAEIHALDTDIVYVVEGTATLVTGGKVVDGKTIAPDEIRGPRIDGGASRQLKRGDVVVVPAGVPHWFEAVPAPFTYFVVKVTSPACCGGAGS